MNLFWGHPRSDISRALKDAEELTGRAWRVFSARRSMLDLGTLKHGEYAVRRKWGMARREYVSREERSRTRSHRACRSWKEKLLFHSKQQELKKLPGTILSCLQTSEEPLYKNPLNLPTHPQNIFLSAPKQSPWNGKSLAPDEINFSIVFKYQLFPLESQFRYLLVPKKNCQSSSFIIVYIVYNM